MTISFKLSGFLLLSSIFWNCSFKPDLSTDLQQLENIYAHTNENYFLSKGKQWLPDSQIPQYSKSLTIVLKGFLIYSKVKIQALQRSRGFISDLMLIFSFFFFLVTVVNADMSEKVFLKLHCFRPCGKHEWVDIFGIFCIANVIFTVWKTSYSVHYSVYLYSSLIPVLINLSKQNKKNILCKTTDK